MIAKTLQDHVFILNKNIEYKVNNFVDEMFESIEYYRKMRGSKNERKVRNDMKLGKKGEFIASEMIYEQTGVLCLPDLNIYKKEDKHKCEFDLADNIHVKTCNLYTYGVCKNDYSWTFNKSNTGGRGGRDKILDKNDGWIILVFLEESNSMIGTVKAVLPWIEAKDYLDDPIAYKLRDEKTCLYYKDLIIGCSL